MTRTRRHDPARSYDLLQRSSSAAIEREGRISTADSITAPSPAETQYQSLRLYLTIHSLICSPDTLFPPIGREVVDVLCARAQKLEEINVSVFARLADAQQD
jgi:hypothetical protein